MYIWITMVRLLSFVCVCMCVHLHLAAGRATLFVGRLIVFLRELDDFDETPAELLQYFAFGRLCVAVVFEAIVRLRDDALDRRLDHVGRDEVARLFRRHDGLLLHLCVACAVRSLHHLAQVHVAVVSVHRVIVVVDVPAACPHRMANNRGIESCALLLLECGGQNHN